MARRRGILMLPVDDERGASTRYRVLAHRPGLEAAGFRTDVRFPWKRAGALRLLWRAADLARDLALASPDVLFVHRKMYPPPLGAWLGGRKHRIVFDMDDALDLPPPSQAQDPAAVQRYRRNFESTVGAAELVLCGNLELARRLPHDRYELLPTAIDTDRFRPGAVDGPDGAPVLGWVGHSDNLPYLESIADPLRELSRRHAGLRLVVVADRPPRIEGLDVEFRRWTLESELSCFRGIAVGLMPLADTPWTRGKCAFKAIQYMALGIPAVASPVGMNREVIAHGETGFLPSASEQWVEVIDRLLSDRSFAASVGDAGRRAVEESYSLAAVSRRLAGIMGQLVPAS